MTTSLDVRQRIEVVADETLRTFKKVSEAALSALHHPSSVSAEVFANLNTFNSIKTLQTLEQINKKNQESCRRLAKEPAVSRVVVVDGAGKKRTFYICRTTPISVSGNDAMLASYLSPVGRLASLPVGEVYPLPNGMVEVLESAQLRPVIIDQNWDARNTVLEGLEYGPVTIKSLRALLSSAVEDELGEDLLERILAEESAVANVYEGKRRSVITKMELRDQPVLDQYQDEIFRLPLDSRLLILGPPGTGKTTTLIRRLGQKLDAEFLSEDERLILKGVVSANVAPHAQNWCMFTPTDLLKQYVKEAFNREGIAASDRNIRTWSDFRRELARNVLGILRTGSGGGVFVLREAMEGLAADAIEKSITWFSDFNEWQKADFSNEIRTAAKELSEDSAEEIATLGQRLLSIAQHADMSNLAATFASLNSEVQHVQTMLGSMKEFTDKKIRDALNLQLNRNKRFLDELAAFMDSLEDASVADDEQDDQDGEEEEEINQPKTGRAAAHLAYVQAIRAQARGHTRKRGPGKTSRTGRILGWLDDCTLQPSDRAEVGTSLIVQARMRRFVNPVRRYLNAIPRRYRAYRRFRQSEGKWYRKEGLNHTEIHPLELDIALLVILKSASELLRESVVVRDIEAPTWSSLRPIRDLYKNQILVDEATDFSPVQIACMAALTHPRIRSFFACGDFNQRLTTWGSRSIGEMKWVVPEIETKVITISYRQSRQLNEFARAVIRAADDTDSGVTLPEDVNNEGELPVLAEGVSNQGALVDWLAERILEIEAFVKQLPSIAVLVTREADVQPLAGALDQALAHANIRVVACPNGQVIGPDNDVRVFDVQHIKGLEFEAVFFIGIDQLAKMHPGLFDKYLYVGATRAAAYLGLTCEGVLPAALNGLRSMFVSDWATARIDDVAPQSDRNRRETLKN